MSARSHDAELWEELDRLLQRRAGWTFQASPSPGVPPSWCFGTGHDRDLAVSVDGGSICVYVVEADHELRMDGTDELVRWISSCWPDALPDQRQAVADRMRSGNLFRWE